MSNIAKRHIPTQELLGAYLTFVPQPKIVDTFAVDMKTLHPTLLRDSIKEAVQTQQVQDIPHHEQRAAIHKIYTRKIKEFSSLYPFIFAVENGLRSALADHLAIVFGRMDWWTILWTAYKGGKKPDDYTQIRTVDVNIEFAKAIWFIFREMVNSEHIVQISGDDKSDEFFYTLSFGQIWKLMFSDWKLMRGIFLSDADLGKKLTQMEVNDAMRIVKDGRNEIFHSNPIKNRSNFVAACDRLLDALAFNLDDYDQDLANTTIVRIKGNIARAKRHIIPPR